MTIYKKDIPTVLTYSLQDPQGEQVLGAEDTYTVSLASTVSLERVRLRYDGRKAALHALSLGIVRDTVVGSYVSNYCDYRFDPPLPLRLVRHLQPFFWPLGLKLTLHLESSDYVPVGPLVVLGLRENL